MPGCAGRETAHQTHFRIFRTDGPGKHPMARPGVLAGNPVHEDIVEAVTRGDLARVKELVEKNPELAKARTPRSATLLHVAARLDNDAIATYLIEKGADVNAVQDDSRTPLLEAGILKTNISASNGVIHVIGAVLLP